MLTILASQVTDQEDQDLPEEVKRLSKLTKCLEKRGAPKFREHSSSSESSSEDDSQKAKERRRAARKRKINKKNEGAQAQH